MARKKCTHWVQTITWYIYIFLLSRLAERGTVSYCSQCASSMLLFVNELKGAMI